MVNFFDDASTTWQTAWLLMQKEEAARHYQFADTDVQLDRRRESCPERSEHGQTRALKGPDAAVDGGPDLAVKLDQD